MCKCIYVLTSNAHKWMKNNVVLVEGFLGVAPIDLYLLLWSSEVKRCETQYCI